MTPERWKQVNDLFNCAMERNSDERAEFIDQACGDDSELRNEVDSLI